MRIREQAIFSLAMVLAVGACACSSGFGSRDAVTRDADSLYKNGKDEKALERFTDAMAIPGGTSNPVLGWAHILLVRDALGGNHASGARVIAELGKHDFSSKPPAILEAAILYRESAQLMLGDRPGAEKSLALVCAAQAFEACMKAQLEIYKEEALGSLGRFELESYFLFSNAQYMYFHDSYFAGQTLYALGYVDFSKAVAMKNGMRSRQVYDSAVAKQYCEMVAELSNHLTARGSSVSDGMAREAEECASSGMQ